MENVHIISDTSLKFYTKFKKLYILKDSLKMKKMIKIISLKFGSTIGKNILSQCLIILDYFNMAIILTH